MPYCVSVPANGQTLCCDIPFHVRQAAQRYRKAAIALGLDLPRLVSAVLPKGSCVLQFGNGDYFKRHIMINTLDIIVDAGDEMLVDGLTNL